MGYTTIHNKNFTETQSHEEEFSSKKNQSVLLNQDIGHAHTARHPHPSLVGEESRNMVSVPEGVLGSKKQLTTKAPDLQTGDVPLYLFEQTIKPNQHHKTTEQHTKTF